MSRFRRLSHTIWHCQYHIVWAPKYRSRILVGAVKETAEVGIQAICGFAGYEVVELNVQRGPSASSGHDPAEGVGLELGRQAQGSYLDEAVNQFRQMRKKPYWGNHSWSKGYCVDTVGLDADMIRKYVRYREEKEKQLEQLQLS